MSLPSWQQGQAEEELEYQRTMKRLGEAEQERVAANFYMDGDVLGVDDGRAGIGWAGWYGGLTFGSNYHFIYAVISLIVVILIIVIGQGLKHAQRAQQIIQQQNSGQIVQSAPPQAP
jgi:hypothetical protein